MSKWLNHACGQDKAYTVYGYLRRIQSQLIAITIIPTDIINTCFDFYAKVEYLKTDSKDIKILDNHHEAVKIDNDYNWDNMITGDIWFDSTLTNIRIAWQFQPQIQNDDSLSMCIGLMTNEKQQKDNIGSNWYDGMIYSVSNTGKVFNYGKEITYEWRTSAKDYQYKSRKIFYLCLDFKTGKVEIHFPIPGNQSGEIYYENVCESILRQEGLKYRVCAKIYRKDDQLNFTRFGVEE